MPPTLTDATRDILLAAEFLKSPFFMAQVREAVQSAVVASNSPWLNRKDAAAYARCSTRQIDRKADEGIIKRYSGLFKRSEITLAIEKGIWKQG